LGLLQPSQNATASNAAIVAMSDAFLMGTISIVH
jgi:hypothetical protein